MKIVIESLSNPVSFNPIIFIDQVQFYNEYGVHPILSVRQEYAGRNIIVLTTLNNIYGTPEKRVLQTDLPNEDGVIHYGALFKPYEFDVGGELDGGAIDSILMTAFRERGLCKITMYADNGVISDFKIATLNALGGILTCQNTELTTNIEQITKYLMNMQLSVFNTVLYAGEQLYTSKKLFPEERSSQVYTKDLKERIYVAIPNDFLIEYKIEANKTVEISSFKTNGINWNAGVQRFNDNDVIIFANNSTSDFPYETPGALKIYRKDPSGNVTEIGSFTSDLFKNNNSIELDMIFYDVVEQPNTQEYYCKITTTVNSKGTGVLPG